MAIYRLLIRVLHKAKSSQGRLLKTGEIVVRKAVIHELGTDSDYVERNKEKTLRDGKLIVFQNKEGKKREKNFPSQSNSQAYLSSMKKQPSPGAGKNRNYFRRIVVPDQQIQSHKPLQSLAKPLRIAPSTPLREDKADRIREVPSVNT